MNIKKEQKGVALILVLSVIVMVSLAILQVGLTAKENVRKARVLHQRADALTQLYSVEAEVVFSLLTQPLVANEPRGVSTIARDWNFSGKAFEFKGVKVRLLDEKGLFPVPRDGEPVHPFGNLLAASGISSRAREEVLRVFRGSKTSVLSNDLASQVPVQSIWELASTGALSEAEVNRIQDLVTLYPVVAFNPAAAPDLVLYAKYPSSPIRESLIAFNHDGGLSPASYFRVVGEGGAEEVEFYPGPGIRMALYVPFNGVELGTESVLTVKPYDVVPVELWSRRTLSSSMVAK